MQPVLGCNVATQPIYRANNRNLHPDETCLAITLRVRPKNLRILIDSMGLMRKKLTSLGRCSFAKSEGKQKNCYL